MGTVPGQHVQRMESMEQRARAFAAAGGLAAALRTGAVPRQIDTTLSEELRAALHEAYRHPGLSLVHVPVYYGPDPLGGLGAYGVWNVGNWCGDVQARYHGQDI